MPRFGRVSRLCLSTCRDELVVLAEETLAVGMDFAVIHGHRGEELQEDLFRKGFSKVRWPNSKHNKMPSEALDVAPWPIDWQDSERFYHLIGIVRCKTHELGFEIRCGLDWDRDFDLRDQTFMDLGHVEILLPGGDTP